MQPSSDFERAAEAAEPKQPSPAQPSDFDGIAEEAQPNSDSAKWIFEASAFRLPA